MIYLITKQNGEQECIPEPLLDSALATGSYISSEALHMTKSEINQDPDLPNCNWGL